MKRCSSFKREQVRSSRILVFFFKSILIPQSGLSNSWRTTDNLQQLRIRTTDTLSVNQTTWTFTVRSVVLAVKLLFMVAKISSRPMNSPWSVICDGNGGLLELCDERLPRWMHAKFISPLHELMFGILPVDILELRRLDKRFDSLLVKPCGGDCRVTSLALSGSFWLSFFPSCTAVWSDFTASLQIEFQVICICNSLYHKNQGLLTWLSHSVSSR